MDDNNNVNNMKKTGNTNSSSGANTFVDSCRLKKMSNNIESESESEVGFSENNQTENSKKVFENESTHQIEIFNKPKFNKNLLKNNINENESKNNFNNEASDTGNLLEYRIKRLLFYMGYFPVIGILLKTSQEEDSETVTDLDVFGVYIHKDFRQKTIWVDCKSGKAKPLEHISWLMGVRQLYNVDDIVFVKSNVKSTIKNFARKNNIEVLDMSLIGKLESDLLINPNDWSGSWNHNVIFDKINHLSKITITNNDKFNRIKNFIMTDYWISNAYTRIKKTITALKELSAVPLELLNNDDIIAVKFGVYELTKLLILSVLSICKELYYFSDIERYRALHDGMISGELSIKKRTEILNASYKLAIELVKSQVPDYTPPSVNSFNRLVPPSYFESLIDLIKRVTHNPNDYYDLLRPLDYMLNEYDLLLKEYDWNKINKMFNNIEGNIKGIKTFLHFICNVTGIPKTYYQILSKKQLY